jgi:uncharacterized damage-inducible protein DinB
MNTVTLKMLFQRDLEKLKTEIGLYKDPAQLWATDRQIANSGGNLCLHITGNLNTYIGAGLAGTGYVRQRELEFSQKNVPAETLMGMIEETKINVEQGLSRLLPEDGEKEFPILIWNEPTTVEHTLVQLLTHLNYHLGQINYHRRLLDTNT